MNATSTALDVRRDPELDRYARLGQWLAASESGADNPNALGAAAALRLFYASELGLPPMAAAELSVIHGRLFVQAKLLRALAARHGYRVVRTPDSDATTCTAVLVGPTGDELGRTTFTMEDAKKAGLVRQKSGWEKHPARMLWARASKYVLDDFAPEVTLGLATEDEAAEIQDRPAADPDDGDGAGAEDAEWTPAEPAKPQDPVPPSQEQQDAFYKPEPIQERQRNHLFALMESHGIDREDRETRLKIASGFMERDVASFNDLSKAEATRLIVLLQAWDPDNPQTAPFPEGY